MSKIFEEGNPLPKKKAYQKQRSPAEQHQTADLSSLFSQMPYPIKAGCTVDPEEFMEFLCREG